MGLNTIYRLLLWIGLGAIGVITYSPSFLAPFHFDDLSGVVYNRAINNLDWLRIWQQDPARFLTNLSFAYNYQISGLNTIVYHWINFLIHLGVTISVYFLCTIILSTSRFVQIQNDTKERIAFCAALMFLVHPLGTSTVTYICQRAVLLAAFFYLTAIICYALFRIGGKRIFLIFSFFAAFLGIFCKQNFATLPLALILFELCFLSDRKTFKYIFPYVIIACGVLVLLVLWKYQSFEFAHLAGITRETQVYSRSTYLFTQFNVLWTYIRLFFFPVHQNFDYDYPIAANLFEFPTIISFLGHIVLIVMAVRCVRKYPLVSFCIGWFYVTLSIESSIFPIADVIFEHRTYLPMIGLVILVSFVLFQLSQKVHLSLAIILIIVLSLLAHQRNLVWSNARTLLEDTARKSPNKSRVYNNLGQFYYSEGEKKKALAAFNEAIKKDPKNSNAVFNIGLIYFFDKEYRKALEIFDKALLIEPNMERGHVFKGNAYYLLKDYREALKEYGTVLMINPEANIYNNRGLVYMALGENTKALDDFNKALSLDEDSQIYDNRAKLFAQMRKQRQH